MTQFENIPVASILPQRPPFVFVDRLLHYDEHETLTSYTVPQEGIFVEDGKLRTAGLVEHMAQSGAARVGYISKYILHVPVRIGYIGQVRGLTVLRNPSCGETLTTKVVLIQDMFGITLTDVEVRCAGELIASASVKTALSDKEIEE